MFEVMYAFFGEKMLDLLDLLQLVDAVVESLEKSAQHVMPVQQITT